MKKGKKIIRQIRSIWGRAGFAKGSAAGICPRSAPEEKSRKGPRLKKACFLAVARLFIYYWRIGC